MPGPATRTRRLAAASELSQLTVLVPPAFRGVASESRGWARSVHPGALAGRPPLGDSCKVSS